MKRSVNLKGNRWGGASQEAKNLIATFRFLGYSDAQIKDELRRWQEEQDADAKRTQPCPECGGTGHRYNRYGEMAECMGCDATGKVQP